MRTTTTDVTNQPTATTTTTDGDGRHGGRGEGGQAGGGKGRGKGKKTAAAAVKGVCLTVQQIQARNQPLFGGKFVKKIVGK